jgi:hypothetical protein
MLLLPDDLVELIEDFRYDQRFPSRTAAIIWLLRWALSQKPKRA